MQKPPGSGRSGRGANPQIAASRAPSGSAAPPSGRPQRSNRSAAAAAAAQQQRSAVERRAEPSEEEEEAAAEPEPEPEPPAWLQPELRVEVEGDSREGFPETYCAAVVSRAEVVDGRVEVEYEEVRLRSETPPGLRPVAVG